jgi:hypothetical protein
MAFVAIIQLPPIQQNQLRLLRKNGAEKFTSFLDIIAYNSFDSGDGTPSHGLFPLGSRFNHSCLPNAMVPFTAGPFIELYAINDIEAGEEIYFCLLQTSKPKPNMSVMHS